MRADESRRSKGLLGAIAALACIANASVVEFDPWYSKCTAAEHPQGTRVRVSLYCDDERPSTIVRIMCNGETTGMDIDIYYDARNNGTCHYTRRVYAVCHQPTITYTGRPLNFRPTHTNSRVRPVFSEDCV